MASLSYSLVSTGGEVREHSDGHLGVTTGVHRMFTPDPRSVAKSSRMRFLRDTSPT